jgi:hypothetical protein
VQGGLALVVGGVGFEHDARLPAMKADSGGGVRVVVLDLLWSKSTPGCTTMAITRRHAPCRSCSMKACGARPACARGLRAGDGAGLRQRGFAARNRHFGADHVDRRRQAGLRGGRFGDDAQARRARRDDSSSSGTGIVGAAHAAIEVDLVEAGRA